MNLLLQLLRTARQVYPDRSCRDRLSSIKYCLRGLLTSRLTREWFEILARPKLAIVAGNHPHILSKLQRPYLHSAPGPWSRLRALKNHYRFVDQRLSLEAVEQIYSSKGLLLARISLPNDSGLELRLGYHDFLSKEGDLAVSIHDDSPGEMLAALSFCVWKYGATPTQAFVGGLQSFNRPKQKERIVAITRALHGLRPKGLLFFTLQQLAEAWEIDSIKAVSNARHVYRHYRKRKNVAVSYDDFWVECGGHFDPDGLFTLPPRWVARDLSLMKASKRQMYRHRYVLLEKLGLQIGESAAQYTLPTNWTSQRSDPELISINGTDACRPGRFYKEGVPAVGSRAYNSPGHHGA